MSLLTPAQQHQPSQSLRHDMGWQAKIWSSLFAVTLATSWGATSVPAVETNVLVRDPSTIVKRNGTYWIYGTGTGTQQFFFYRPLALDTAGASHTNCARLGDSERAWQHHQ